MVAFPPCKVNLGLQILSRRPDGFHNISTCFYSIPLTDVLEILPSAEFQFTQTGIPIDGPTESNLCLKAYRALGDLPHVHIHLHKVIPTGSGLGGGSSDGAYTLRMLNGIFNLKLTHEQVHEKAIQLGSDCSFFLQDLPKVGTGKGDVLAETPVSLRGLFIVLVFPEIHVSTAEAYAEVSPGNPDHALHEILAKPVTSWRNLLVNDFERSIFKKYPLIAEAKQHLYDEGAIYAAMSGSGSSVFGLFEKETPMYKFNKFKSWSGWL